MGTGQAICRGDHLEKKRTGRQEEPINSFIPAMKASKNQIRRARKKALKNEVSLPDHLFKTRVNLTIYFTACRLVDNYTPHE